MDFIKVTSIMILLDKDDQNMLVVVIRASVTIANEVIKKLDPHYYTLWFIKTGCNSTPSRLRVSPARRDIQETKGSVTVLLVPLSSATEQNPYALRSPPLWICCHLQSSLGLTVDAHLKILPVFLGIEVKPTPTRWKKGLLQLHVYFYANFPKYAGLDRMQGAHLEFPVIEFPVQGAEVVVRTSPILNSKSVQDSTR